MPSDIQIDSGVYHDDSIFLNGVEILVRSPIRAGLASEFATGLKIGRATYDHREHASWVVFDDFTGGFGHRTLDIREAGGTHWDSVGGVDLRRSRHITLPALRYDVDADLDPTAISRTPETSTKGWMVYFNPVASGDIVAGIGTHFYRSQSGGDLIQGTSVNPSQITKIVDFTTPDGDRYLFAVTTGEYYRSANGWAWTAASAIPSSGVTNLEDLIVWGDQLVAVTQTHQIISSADGVTWTIDETPPEEPIFHAATGFPVRFVGVAMGQWGEPVVYFLSEGRLWAADFYVKTAYRVEDLGDLHHLWHGTVWNGSVWVTDGINVWQYTPATQDTVRQVGPFGKDGMPPTWAARDDTLGPFPNEDDSYRIVQFIPGVADLWAVCRVFHETGGSSWAGNEMRLLVFNGTGWSWYGPEVTGAVPCCGMFFGGSWAGLAYMRRLIVVSYADANAPDYTLTLHRWPMPVVSNVPTTRWREAFEAGPLSFEIGWFDGGFVELEGALLHLSIDGYNINADESVLVEYRLNNDERAGYTTLGTFTQNQQRIWFDRHHRGVVFKTVEFRITLDRGSDVSFSPELVSLILLYDKKPAARTSWTIQVDVARMVERGIHIQGQEASTEVVWQFLKSLASSPQLIRLEVPSLESGGVNVRITDMPASMSDIRVERGGRGTIDLQMIEPAAE